MRRRSRAAPASPSRRSTSPSSRPGSRCAPRHFCSSLIESARLCTHTCRRVVQLDARGPQITRSCQLGKQSPAHVGSQTRTRDFQGGPGGRGQAVCSTYHLRPALNAGRGASCLGGVPAAFSTQRPPRKPRNSSSTRPRSQDTHGSHISSQDVLSAALYPSVFTEFQARFSADTLPAARSDPLNGKCPGSHNLARPRCHPHGQSLKGGKRALCMELQSGSVGP